MDGSKIVLELTALEAKVLIRALQNHNPSTEDEMLVVIIYNKIIKLIEK